MYLSALKACAAAHTAGAWADTADARHGTSQEEGQ